MKILDLDMDYFNDNIAYNIKDNLNIRLSEYDYGCSVWSKERVVDFLENNLGLKKNKKIKGRIVCGHDEALLFWKELIEQNKLTIPFEVIHVDSHADLGLGYPSWKDILDKLLLYPKEDRQKKNFKAKIGDYLLFAIAYQWISKLTYCANPSGDKSDYIIDILKDFHENRIFNKPVKNIIQLAHNDKMNRPEYYDDKEKNKEYFKTAKKDPEVPFIIIPTIEGVKYRGDFDFALMAQSPNYTPASADYIIDVFKNYIQEI